MRSTATILECDTSAPPIARMEWAAAVALLLAGLLLRGGYLFRYRFDSDEPQHLHVAWGWSRGLVQYRDVFDNHTPLFHLLFAPLVKWVGEKPQLLYVGRAAMLPFYLIALLLTFRIGAALFGRRCGLWAAIAVGLLPSFFCCSLEFRADDLWMVLWLATMLALFGGRASGRRGFVAGILLGAAFAASIKTVLLVFTVALAAGVVFVVGAMQGSPWARPRQWYAYLGALAAGTMLVPTLLILMFARLGALDAMFGCVILHNNVPGAFAGAGGVLRALSFGPIAVGIIALALGSYGTKPLDGMAARRVIAVASAAAALAGFFTIFPIADWQDFLPVDPLLALGLAAVLFRLRPRWALASAITVASSELLLLVIHFPIEDKTVGPIHVIANVLRLTAPDEYVMDLKGETVFRRRAVYEALERVARERFRHGMLIDDIPERLVATGARVATVDSTHSWFPPRGQAFLNAHYITVCDSHSAEPTKWAAGAIRVVGQLLEPSKTTSFQVVIPTEYAIISDDGKADGKIDGTPLTGPRFLAPGFHTFEPRTGGRSFALVWARAVERGFTPFGPPSVNERSPKTLPSRPATIRSP